MPLAGGEVRQVTTFPGMHDVTMSHSRQLFVDVCSSAVEAFRVDVCDVHDGASVLEVPLPLLAQFGNPSRV